MVFLSQGGFFFFSNSHAAPPQHKTPSRPALPAMASFKKIRIVGSSAMYPFVVSLADVYGRETSHPTPVVEATGTGGGIKLFCASSLGPSLVAASRPMTAQEKKYCQKNGVSFHKIVLGMDGLILAKLKKMPPLSLSMDQLRFILVDRPQSLKEKHGDLKRPSSFPSSWHHLDPAFPKIRIKILAPSPSSGTREALEHLILRRKERFRQDRTLRNASDQEAVIVQKLLHQKNALGIISYGFLMQNAHALEAVALDGVLPTEDTISTKKYPLVRELYVYVNKDHARNVPMVLDFVLSLWDDTRQSLLRRQGLIQDPTISPAKQKNGFLALVGHGVKGQKRSLSPEKLLEKIFIQGRNT